MCQLLYGFQLNFQDQTMMDVLGDVASCIVIGQRCEKFEKINKCMSLHPTAKSILSVKRLINRLLVQNTFLMCENISLKICLRSVKTKTTSVNVVADQCRYG